MPANLLLSGTVSTYGLLGIDERPLRLGVFAVPTQDLHVVNPPVTMIIEPGLHLYEAALWCRRALDGSPTESEMLWLPDYDHLTELGDELRDIRSAFLSGPTVRSGFMLQAHACIENMPVRLGDFSPTAKKQTSDAAQHLLRLCWQGYHLYSTGYLPLQVDEPKRFLAFGQRVAEGHIDVARDVLTQYEAKFNGIHSPLPDTPNGEAVDRWLRFVRLKFL